MADKIYKLIFEKDDGSEAEVQFTAPQGPQGEKGADGTSGKDGFSPTVYVTKSGKETEIHINAVNGPQSVTILDGADGKDGTNGVSATHSWNGTTLTITSASGTSSANLKGEKGDTGDSYTLTEADKDDIAALAATLLKENGVIGVVDENNNIIVSGNLADGTYNVKYEMADGSTIDIGNLVLSDKPTYKNLADPTSADWKTGYRLNSSGSVSVAEGITATNYVPVKNGDVVRIKGMNLTTHNTHFLKADKTLTAYGAGNLTNSTFAATDISATTTGGQFTVNNAEVAWVRFSGALNGTANDVIITINEPIE